MAWHAVQFSATRVLVQYTSTTSTRTSDGKTGVKLRDIFYVGDITGLHNDSFLAELCSARTRVENYTQYALSTLLDDSIDAATFRRSALQNVE